MESAPTKEEIKLTIENALLHNNKQLTDEFEKIVEKRMDKLSENLSAQTTPLLGEIVKLVQGQQELKGENDKRKEEIEAVKNDTILQKRTLVVYGGAGLLIIGAIEVFLQVFVK